MTIPFPASTRPDRKVREETRAMIFSYRCSLVGAKGLMTTRELVGLRTIPVRWTSMGETCNLGSRGGRPVPGGPTLPRAAEGRQGALQQVHLGEREEER